jgi:hypothetical protein
MWPVPTRTATGRLTRVTTALLLTVGAALLVAGVMMSVRAVEGRQRIRHELTGQRICFPDVEQLPAAFARYAGRRVRTGGQARAFADLIGTHVAKATAGMTYAEITEELRACGGADERLTKLRETAFMGQSLRASLLSAYQAWQITTLVVGLGGLLSAIGLVFLALAVA